LDVISTRSLVENKEWHSSSIWGITAVSRYYRRNGIKIHGITMVMGLELMVVLR